MTFNISNHIYAATRQRGGFGVFYQSSNLSDMTEVNKNMVNRNGNYQAPDALKENPPINYAYYLIDDHGLRRAVLLRSCYTGATNHTPDRMGNYLTHTVVFDNPMHLLHRWKRWIMCNIVATKYWLMRCNSFVRT